MKFLIGNCEIDTDRHEFLSAGTPVKLEPQVFDLIALLASNPGRLVSRDELVEAIWHGRVVSDSTIDARVAAARKALGDDGTRQSVIEAPTLVVHAARDAVQPFAEGVRLAEAIRRAELLTVDSRNHFAMLEDPAWSRAWDEIIAFASEPVDR